MFKVTKYPHGTFSWADCNSTNQDAAKQFYADVMGWQVDDVPMGGGQVYTMFKMDGESVAGLGPMQPDVQAMGIPSHWNSYVNVEDVDSITAKAKELGATVLMEPLDVFENGRMSLIQDPTGAQLGLWQPKEHKGAGLVNTPGAMTWNELATRDVAKAQDFFSKLFGWEIEKDPNMDYYYIKNNGRMNAGMIPMNVEWGDMQPHWMTYFSVADIDQSVEKVKGMGGSVPMEIMSGSVGRFTVIADPAGAHSTLIQLTNPQPWEE